MKKLFGIDGKLFNSLNTLANLLWLNILTVLLCIPVVTAGASFAAMYSVTLPMVRGEESYITKSFFKGFKNNFIQATIMWLILLAGALVLWMDLNIITKAAPWLFYYMLIQLCALLILLLALYLYIFPLQAYFKNTIRGTMLNALKLALVHLPYTLVFLILQSMPWILFYLVNNQALIAVIGWGFSGIAYLSSYAYRGIFAKYEAPEEQESQMQDIPAESPDDGQSV